MNPADQYVARDPLKDAIGPQISPAAVLVDLSRVSGAELRIESLKCPPTSCRDCWKQIGPLDFVIPQVPSDATRMYS